MPLILEEKQSRKVGPLRIILGAFFYPCSLFEILGPTWSSLGS